MLLLLLLSGIMLRQIIRSMGDKRRGTLHGIASGLAMELLM